VVRFQDEESDRAELVAGVSQGLILGPILFLVNVNDLPRVIKEGRYVSFADDTAIVWRHRNLLLLEEMVLRDLAAVKLWGTTNSLTLNVGKTNIINFKCSFMPHLITQHIWD